MGIIRSLLLQEDYKWWLDEDGTTLDAIESIRDLMGPLIGICAVMGVIYVIVLWVNYIKADGSKRPETVTRIKNAVIGFVILLVVMSLFTILLNNIDPIAEWIDGLVGEGQGFGD